MQFLACCVARQTWESSVFWFRGYHRKHPPKNQNNRAKSALTGNFSRYTPVCSQPTGQLMDYPQIAGTERSYRFKRNELLIYRMRESATTCKPNLAAHFVQ